MSIALPHEPADGERAEGAGSAEGGRSLGPLRVRRNGMLYRMGEPRSCLYKIEAGVVALLRQAPGGQREIVEFAFAGDVLGFGLFENHTAWAQAVGEVRVQRMALAALDEILAGDKRAFERYAEALARDFEYRREQVVNTERSLVSRLAALLVALSRQNALEGRDPRRIGDELECGAVAAWLNIDVRALADALLELERSGLIERSASNGLRLSDPGRLERLADERSFRTASAFA